MLVKENTLLYEMLSAWSTKQLDERLAQELHKESVDEETVRTILAVLREREKEEPVEITPQIKTVWEKYQKGSASIPKMKPKRVANGLLRAASVCIVVMLLFSLIPMNAQADNFWERVARWTSEIFEFFNPHAKEAVQEKYVFKTDNSGLQQVYDAVVELGITAPVVPMWFPEGYELIECIKDEEQDFDRVFASFSQDGKAILFEVRIYSGYVPGQYQKDGTDIVRFEDNGTEYHIFRNYDMWIVTWTKENVECYFTVDCQEDIMYKILASIYEMEESA